MKKAAGSGWRKSSMNKNERIKQNLHTHTEYDDGKDSVEEMVKEAIAQGFTLLGFSGHGFNHPLDEDSMTEEKTKKYLEDIAEAREEYGDRIQILAGIEQDSMQRLDRSPFDYVISSVHFIEKDGKAWPVDYSEERFEAMLKEGFGGDIHALMKAYFDEAERAMDFEEADLVGHIDLIAKYNEGEKWFSFSDPYYLELAKHAIDRGIQNGLIFEMNTGAISRGYRTEAYPEDHLLEYMADHGAKLCINTDCHDRKNLSCGIEDCLERAKKAGFRELWTFADGGFVPAPIERFDF